MPEIIPDQVSLYAERFSTPVDPLLQEIQDFTLAHHAHAQMLSGPLQGKFLEFISILLKPSCILEIGTFTGFSALCLAKGLQPHGRLHTIELREDDAATASGYFAKSSHNDQIILHRGNALDIIPELPFQWDLVFIDADKVNYIRYYELSLPRLKKGGVILADNVLFHGDVLQDPVKGKNGKAIHSFNEYVAKDARVEQVILTVRDGLMMVIKK